MTFYKFLFIILAANNLYICSTTNKHCVFKDAETLHAALMYFFKSVYKY